MRVTRLAALEHMLEGGSALRGPSAHHVATASDVNEQ
jgi:hypothetical protein